jgi:hypothetical protein
VTDELERLRSENKRLRQQFVSVVRHVLAGCTGVTIASNDAGDRPPRGSKLVHRCLLEKRLQDALREQTTDYPGPI